MGELKTTHLLLSVSTVVLATDLDHFPLLLSWLSDFTCLMMFMVPMGAPPSVYFTTPLFLCESVGCSLTYGVFALFVVVGVLFYPCFWRSWLRIAPFYWSAVLPMVLMNSIPHLTWVAESATNWLFVLWAFQWARIITIGLFFNFKNI